MSATNRSNAALIAQQQLIGTARSIFHLCRSNERAAAEEIEAYARELSNNEVDRILEVIERAALGQLDVPFAVEDGARVVLSMPRLWARCISLLLQMMQAERISGHTAMLLMSEIRMCLVVQYRKLQLSVAALSSESSAIEELQAVCKRCIQPFMQQSSKITAGEVLCLEALPSLLRVLAACPVCEGVVDQIVDIFLQGSWPAGSVLPIMTVFADIAALVRVDAWKTLMHKIQACTAHSRDNSDFAGLIRLCLRLAASRKRPDTSEDTHAARDMAMDWLDCARGLYARVPESEVQTVEILLEQFLLQVPLVVERLVSQIEASCLQQHHDDAEQSDVSEEDSPVRPLSWHDIRLLMLLGRSFRVSASERALVATSAISSKDGGSREIDLAAFRRKIQDHICRVLFTCMMTWSSSDAPGLDSAGGGSLKGLLVRTLGTAMDAEPQASQSSSGPTWSANFATAASCARAELLLQTCIRVMQFDKAVIPAVPPSTTVTQRLRPARNVTGVRDKAPLEGGVDYAAAFMPATDYVAWASKDAVASSSASSVKPFAEVVATSAQQFARETLKHVYDLVQASRAAVVSGVFQAAHQVLTGPDQRVAWDRKGVVQSFQLALLDIISREDHDEPVLKEFQKLLPTLFTLPDPFCSGLLVPVCKVCCNSSAGVHQVRQLCRKQLQRPNHSMKARAIDAMAAILPQLERSAQLDLIQALGFVFTFPVQYRKRLYGGVATHFLRCCFSPVRHSMHGDALQLLATKFNTQLQQYFQSPDEQGEADVDGLLVLNVDACFDSTGGKDAEFVLKDDFAGLLVAKWLSDILADRQAARSTFDGLINYLTKAASAQGSSKRQAMPAWTGEMSKFFAATLKFLETGLGDKDETDRLVPQKLEWQLAYELFCGLVTVLSISCRLFAPEQDDALQQRCVEALSCVQGLTDILLEVLQQRTFGRAYDGTTQPYTAQSKPSSSNPLTSSASWAELQTWMLGKQAHWYQQLHCHDGTEQYPRSVLTGTLACTLWQLGQGLTYGGRELNCSLQQTLQLLANAYEAFVSYKVEQDVLNLVPRWACAQPQRQQKRPSRRAAQKVQLRSHSAYMEAQQITLSDSDGEDRAERTMATLDVQTLSEPLPPINWSVGSATAFFRQVLTSLPRRVVTALDRHDVECIRAAGNESSPRLVVNSVTNRLRMDILHLRTHVLEVLASVANHWCGAAAVESSQLDVGGIASISSSSMPAGQLMDTGAVPLYEFLAIEFENSIADGLPPRLCIAYCDAILGFVRCLRERSLLAVRQQTDGATAVVRHRKTNAAFDLTAASDMRTCSILFNIMGKYSLPYGTVLRKLLDLVLLLSGNALSVSKDICECCLNYTVEQARPDQEKAMTAASSSSVALAAPIVALTSKAQCEQVFQHMLRAAEAELMSSRPRLLPLEDLTSFMAMFWSSFRTLASSESAADASASKKQLALDLFTTKTQARLLKMFTELLRKCVKEMNLMVQLHAVFKKLPRPEEPVEPDEVEPPVAISEREQEATAVTEPIGLRILRAVLSQASIPICNIRRWAKRRNAAQSDEVSHQIGNLLYRTEEVELVGARLLRRLGNSDPMRRHARAGAQEAVRELLELVQALLQETTQRTSRKRKVGHTASKAASRRSGSARRAPSSGHTAAVDDNNDEEDDDDDDGTGARIRTSATQRQQAARRRIVADEEEEEEEAEEIQDLDEEEAVSSSSDEGSDNSDDNAAKIQQPRPAAKPARRAKRLRLRSRHDVIDRWLAEEHGDDTYADLEDFIVA